MKAYDLVELAARNLRESVLRNALTTAGIAVGVASLLAMMALGVGLQELAGKRLSNSGLFDTIAVSPSRDDRRVDPDDRDPLPDPQRPARVLDESARREIARIPGVIEAEPELRFVAEVRLNELTRIASVGGLAASARDNEAFDTMRGSFFSSVNANEAILRRRFAEQLRPAAPDSLIGQEIVLRYSQRMPLPEDDEQPSSTGAQNGDSENDAAEQQFGFSVVRREQPLRIVGILEAEPFGGMRNSSRSAVFIPTQLAQELNIMQPNDVAGASRSAERTYSTIMTRVSSPSHVPEVQDAIHRMGFRTFSILDASQGLRRFFTILDLFLGIFGSLALAVASLGIINTLVMAVLERRREIGILKAVGASDGDIQKLFFAEAAAMGLVGGLFGVLLGRAIGLGINFGTGIYMERRQLPPEIVWSAPWWLMGAAILFAVLVSLAAGFYPARRAARLDPVQALRYE